MADIELVIKVPEDTYKDIIKNGFIYDEDNEVVTYAIKNGISLPKGHGNLKDTDKFLKRVEEDRMHECYMRSWTIDDVLQKLDSWYAPIIIEADKESEDKE